MLLLLGVLGQCGNPKTNTVAELETEVKLLKKEIYDQQKIHDRIDVAIEKLTDVSNSIHRMLAVHEEKISRQEESIEDAEKSLENRRTELSSKIDELHSRITTNTKEIMAVASAQHIEQNKEIQKIKDELIARVGVLEKWRHVLIGGSIVIGFILHKFINFST
jgi:chromosome segregation ATPase